MDTRFYLTEDQAAYLEWRSITEYNGEVPVYMRWDHPNIVYFMDGQTAFDIKGSRVTSYNPDVLIGRPYNGIRFALPFVSSVPMRHVR